MQVYYDKLIALLDIFPRHNSLSSANELSNILREYKSILDTVNKTSEDYKRNTNMYYTEISDIEFDIKQSQQAKSQRQKQESFNDAINHLRDDISALASLIKFHG